LKNEIVKRNQSKKLAKVKKIAIKKTRIEFDRKKKNQRE
jgi:hypothetical protein